jgi:predicted N-acetyltransferase YhbS
MPYMHVSNNYRGVGIGKALFEKCVEAAKKMGAKSIYISAHPAIETQKFYKALGCKLAKEINQELKELEPFDIQLEYEIN